VCVVRGARIFDIDEKIPTVLAIAMAIAIVVVIAIDIVISRDLLWIGMTRHCL
jgi:hypothetical protein